VAKIQDILRRWTDNEHMDLIITLGTFLSNLSVSLKALFGSLEGKGGLWGLGNIEKN